MFRLAGFAGIPNELSLLIPIFGRAGRNERYVHIFGRNFIVEEFLEWYGSDDLGDLALPYSPDLERVPEHLIQRNIGNQAIFACIAEGRLVVGEFQQFAESVLTGDAPIINSLLDLQLARLSGSGIKRGYDKIKGFAARAFATASHQETWSKTEVYLLQKNRDIWDSIERQASRRRTDEKEKLAEILSLSREDIFRWLIDKIFADKLWPHVWVGTEDRFGMEERLQKLAEDWLMGSDVDWFFDETNTSIFRRLLAYYRVGNDPSFDFTEWLMDSLEQGAIFSPGTPVRPDDSQASYLLVAERMDVYQRLGILVNVIRQGNYTADLLRLSLGEISRDLSYVDLSRHRDLLRKIENEIVDNASLEDYRKLKDISASLTSIRRTLRTRHSSKV